MSSSSTKMTLLNIERSLSARLVDGKRIVTAGISPADQIIVDGQARVRPGMKVAPRQPAEAHPYLRSRKNHKAVNFGFRIPQSTS